MAIVVCRPTELIDKANLVDILKELELPCRSKDWDCSDDEGRQTHCGIVEPVGCSVCLWNSDGF